MTASTKPGADYANARAAFLAAGLEAHARVASYRNDRAAGPSGEDLFVDVAVLGEPTAPRRLVICSGTHGVEGIGGSECQVAMITSGLFANGPRDVVVVLVHALNPFGFAHLRRVDENNVDLNRNFVDHTAPLPANAAYDELHDLLIPDDWSGTARAAADARIAQLVTARGRRAVQTAITGGQYHRPDGLFYGGSSEAWSNRAWRTILTDHVAGCEHAALVDIHTGLGPHGYGEPIFRGRDDAESQGRARFWYGADLRFSADGSSVSTEITGNAGRAFAQQLDDARIDAITLEFGTIDELSVLNALRGDQWLANRPAERGAATDAIKGSVRDAFYCEGPAWRAAVQERAFQICARTLAGLSSS